MDTAHSDHAYLLGDAGQDLVAALAMVAEAGREGEPRFRPDVVHDLTWAMIGRSYGPAVHELCHLVGAARACGGAKGDFAGFFWGVEPARPAGFHDHLRRHLEGRPGVHSLDRQGLTARYGDGSGFAVTYGRMPFLAALLECLVSARGIGYRVLDDLFRAELVPPLDRAKIAACTNRLSKVIYDYLAEQLPPAQTQRKLKVLVAFLKNRGKGDFDIHAIDDPAVLDFWLGASTDAEEGDFKTYGSAFKAFVRLRQALDAASGRHAFANPLALGGDREAGEWDFEADDLATDLGAATRDPLQELAAPPCATVKFLNGRETAIAAGPLELGTHAAHLPLSWLRHEVFGKVQAALVQALRDRKDPGALLATLAGDGGGDYAACQGDLEELAEHLDKVLLASVHVLAAGRRPEVFEVILALRPDIDLAPLARLVPEAGTADDKVVPLLAEKAGDRLIAALKDREAMGPRLADLMDEAERTFRRMSRKGFEKETALRSDGAEAFAAGAAALLDIRRGIRGFLAVLRNLWAQRGEPMSVLATDRPVFLEQFTRIYGGGQP